MIGTVFTALAIMDTMAVLLGGPVNATVLKWSMRLEGVGKGLPYLLALVLSSLTTIVLAQVRIQNPMSEDELVDEEQRLLSNVEDDNQRASPRR